MGDSDRMKKWLRWIFRGVLIVGAVWLILGTLVTCLRSRQSPTGTMPGIEKARYSVVVQNTGNMLFTDKVTETKTEVKLSGYYELTQRGWTYHKTDLTLNRHDFGAIIVSRR